MGGGLDRKKTKVIFSASELEHYVVSLVGSNTLHKNKSYKFEEHLPFSHLSFLKLPLTEIVVADIPLNVLAEKLPNYVVREILLQHGIFVLQQIASLRLKKLVQQVTSTNSQSDGFVSAFTLNSPISAKHKHEDNVTHPANSKLFPPLPPSRNLRDKIIHCFCTDTSVNALVEEGCAVCGKLVTHSLLSITISDLTPLHLPYLTQDGEHVTKNERLQSTDAHQELQGSILALNCSRVCTLCWKTLQWGSRPNIAFANNMWFGEVPSQLSGLTYIKKLLISRVRHNRYIVKVLSSGSCKMIANVISFWHPSQKIYAALPPPSYELDDIIAFIFTGPSPPTDEDFKRTPMLVHHKRFMMHYTG